MIECPCCQFHNEDGALFCEQCKSDLGVAELAGAQSAAHSAGAEFGASAIPIASVSDIASPVSAVAFAEACVAEAMPVAQLDAGVVAVAEVPIAIAVPLPETQPLTVATELPAAGVLFAEAALLDVPSTRPSTAPDICLPDPIERRDAAPPGAEPVSLLPPDAKPKLVVMRGQRVQVEYPIYEGDNYLGRADEKAVDIDLEDQEPPDRIWSSRQHALINYESGALTIEDLNSTNGTFVNRMRVHPGQKRPLQVNDVIQIGTVHLKVKI